MKIWSKICKLFKKNPNNIAVINLSGVIGQVGKFDKGLNINNVEPLLEKAFSAKKLRAVAINVNSPGGSPVQSELIHDRIKELSAEKKIPVFTFANDIAASGGYFILCAGKEIFASKSSIIGSIGVISAGFGFEELIKKIGVSRRVYAQGKNKSILDPFQKEDKNSIKILNEAQKDVHELFKEIVKKSRGNKLKGKNAQEIDDKLFNGAFWSGQGALNNGLIDKIGNMRDILQKKYGKKIKFINIEPKKKGFVKELLSSKSNNFEQNIIENIAFKIKEEIYFNKFGL
ncbi:S49 family peptidase [Rickettsiales bacterium]|nr:S49 family peptidase [Rickettsiales bacterium]